MVSVSWNIPRCEVLGLRTGRNGQMEWPISIGPVHPRKLVHPKRRTVFSKLFRLYQTDPFRTGLDRNFRKVWLNGSRNFQRANENYFHYYYSRPGSIKSVTFSALQIMN